MTMVTGMTTSMAVSAISVILAIVVTVLLVVMVTPKKKRESLPKFFVFLHDLFNFKYLIIEKILKVVYIFATLVCLIEGFLTIITSPTAYLPGQMVLVGLLLMVLGPIVIRIAFELMMSFLLLVKNTMEINNKIKNQNEQKQETIFETSEEYINSFVPEQKTCAKCGAKISKDGLFCSSCGEKVEETEKDN